MAHLTPSLETLLQALARNCDMPPTVEPDTGGDDAPGFRVRGDYRAGIVERCVCCYGDTVREAVAVALAEVLARKLAGVTGETWPLEGIL